MKLTSSSSSLSPCLFFSSIPFFLPPLSPSSSYPSLFSSTPPPGLHIFFSCSSFIFLLSPLPLLTSRAHSLSPLFPIFLLSPHHTVPSISMLARLDEKLLDVQIVSPGSEDTDKVTALGQSVHLIVEEGLEAYLPMADMIDYAKERVSRLCLSLTAIFFTSVSSVPSIHFHGNPRTDSRIHEDLPN